MIYEHAAMESDAGAFVWVGAAELLQPRYLTVSPHALRRFADQVAILVHRPEPGQKQAADKVG